MKRLMMACLLAVSSHGWTADLDPKCYQLFEQFEQHVRGDRAKAGGIANGMYYMKCWPALQNPDVSSSQQDPQPATDCNSLLPRIVQMINDKAHVNGYSIIQTADAKPMTYDTIDRVAGGHSIFMSIADNRGRSMQVRVPLKHDGTNYYLGRGYSEFGKFGEYALPDPVRVPNSAPFAASPLSGTTRVLDCSAEAQYTQGSYLIQMTLDRNSNGQEFIGLAVLMELR